MLGLLGNPGLGAWPAMCDWMQHKQARAHTMCQSWSAPEQGAGVETVLFHPQLALLTSVGRSQAGCGCMYAFFQGISNCLLIQSCRGKWEGDPGRHLCP